MKNDFSEDTRAILLLCAVLDKNSSVKPLTLTEYNSLVTYLVREGMRPGDLLKYDRIEKIALHARIELKRFNSLLERGFQLGIAVEEWARNGGGIAIVGSRNVDSNGIMFTHTIAKQCVNRFAIRFKALAVRKRRMGNLLHLGEV